MTNLLPLNAAEAEWIASLTRVLRDGGVMDDIDALSTFFAEQRDAWFATPADARTDPNPIINSTGAAVGEFLVEQLGLEWCVASDEYGTEMAVVGQPGNILLYPMNAVAKRWTGESEDSLADFVSTAVSHVREVQRAIARG